MKILHINTYDSYGGAERIAYNLFKSQQNSTLLVKKKLKYFDEKNIIEFSYYRLDTIFDFLDKVVWKFGFKKGFKALFQAGDQFNLTYKKLKSLKVYQEADLIHFHNIHGSYFDISAIESIAKEKRVVWTIHDMWPFTGGEAYKSSGVNNNYSNQNNQELENYPLNNPIIDRRNYFLNFKKHIYKKYSDHLYFIPVSNWLKICLENSDVYHDAMKIKLIYNGIDISKYHNLQNRYWTTPRVLFFNSDSPFKGSDVFINSFQNVNCIFDLYVVGNVIPVPKKTNINVTYFKRAKEEKQLINLFNNVDILVFPSKSEAFGLLPAEAMLCGVAVIASDAGGLKELVIPDLTGLLFENGNGADLVSKLEGYLNNLELTRKIGSRSREFVVNNFSLLKMLDSYNQLYKNILEGSF